MLDLKTRPTSSGIPLKQSTTATVNNLGITMPKIESNVIKIIQREWEKEVERLDAKKNGFKGKQPVGDKSLV